MHRLYRDHRHFTAGPDLHIVTLSNQAGVLDPDDSSIGCRLMERMRRENIMRHKRDGEEADEVSTDKLRANVVTFSRAATSPTRIAGIQDAPQTVRPAKRPAPVGRIASRLIREWQSDSLLVDAVPGENS